MNQIPAKLEHKRESIKHRLLQRIVTSETGCWLWTGLKKQGRYGTIELGMNIHSTTHRLSYILFKGAIPEGHCVCHSCDVMHCVNPEHLFIGTNDDNVRDRNAKGRLALGSKIAQSKLTEITVKQLRDRYGSGGISYKEAGRLFGVSAQTASDAVRRVSWRHVA